MLAPSHLTFGLFWSGIFVSAATNRDVEWGMNALTFKCILATFLGCLFPDLDSKSSPLSRLLPFLGNPIRRFFPHRTLLHSFSGLLIATFLVCGLMYLLVMLKLWTGSTVKISLITKFFAWSYLSHLLLDTSTVRGVPYFYPFLKNPFGYPSLEEDRIKSGDKRWEFIITTASLIGFVSLTPMMQQGAGTTLANAFGLFEQLREVYVGTVGKEVMLEFEGYLEYDKSPVSGKALILAATGGYFIIHWNGQVRYLGEASGDIRLLKGKGRIRQIDLTPRANSITYRNSPLSDILSDFSGQVLISGHLEANRTFKVRKPYNGTLSISSSSIRMEFASKAEIEALRIEPKEQDLSGTEMQQELQKKKGMLDSLIVLRRNTLDLYQRDNLFARIKEERAGLKKLEEKLQKMSEKEEELLFSGNLSFRILPPLSALSE